MQRERWSQPLTADPRLLLAAPGMKRLVFTSSDEAMLDGDLSLLEAKCDSSTKPQMRL